MSEEAEPAGRTFRAEVRDWLRAHVPDVPLPSVDTAEGFERHRSWERELAAARLSVISWPADYGGRGATLLEWLAFEDEYYAASAPVRVGQNGIFQGGRHRRGAPGRQGRAPGPRRDRLHPGARPAPLANQGARPGQRLGSQAGHRARVLAALAADEATA